MPDVEFARTLFIFTDHLIHTGSIFLRSGSNFEIELNRYEFVSEICREFGLAPAIEVSRDVGAASPLAAA